MQVFIFGAARTKSALSKENEQLAVEKLIHGQRVLDWTIHGLKKAVITSEQISFIGGFKIEQIIKQYPNINYIVNPKWDLTHVIGSLRYAMEYWRGGDIILLYADTIFRPIVFDNITKTNEDAVIAIDSNWKERLESSLLQQNAEKVILKNGYVKKVGRDSITPGKADAQFSGLTYIKSGVVRKINQLFFDSESEKQQISDKGSLVDLLGIVNEHYKIPIKTYDIANLWAELDSYADLSKFIFGTKAETLERIKPFVKSAKFCEQIHFSLKQWEENNSVIKEQIQQKFRGTNIILRSSSLEEDSWESSQAGAFLSISDINADDSQGLINGVNKIIKGYQEKGNGYNQNNQILVQPFISNVALSGVAFSKNLENGTPYYLINYDDITKKTDAITSGGIADSKSITIYKNTTQQLKDRRISKIINVIDELEKITGYTSLDVEFVLTNNDELYVVQVRPIATHTGLYEIDDFHSRIEEVKTKIRSRLKNYPHIHGDTTVLADMPDWNPAEMIGVRPNPLSISLYQYLITDSAWRVARKKMGYNNPTPEKLLFTLGGHPYIDARNSFNNLIPEGLDTEIADKLLNHYINRLKKNPQFHDKVEFDIVITCFSPDIENHIQRLIEDGFNKEETEKLKQRLSVLTENAIIAKDLSVDNLVAQTEELNPSRKAILNSNYNIDEVPSLVHNLLQDCIEMGTIPFSILARYGFIATSMIQGLVNRKVITSEEKEKFLNSIETVAGEMIEEMNGVLNGRVKMEDFLNKYGHLRPGSYDITSYTYSEKPEYYFPTVNVSTSNSYTTDKKYLKKEYSFDEDTRKMISKEIAYMNMNFSVDQLLDFIRKAIAGREYAKFQFTKNLSAVLSLITEWGNNYGFSRESMSYLFIDDVLKMDKYSMAIDPIIYIKQKIQEGKRWYEDSNKIETPSIITSTDDIEVIFHNVAEPNFITSKKIIAQVISLDEIKDKEELKQKIVMIEGADPGYDWIFLHDIKGLITKYGGAASHMTIRCAEFGLPAAIGCGETMFERLKGVKNVELNCRNKKIILL